MHSHDAYTVDSTAIQIFHGLSLLSRSFTRLRSCNSTHVSHVPLSNSIPYLEPAYQHAEPWFENCLPHTKSAFSCTTHRQDTQHHHTRKLAHSIFVAISKVIFQTLDRLARFVSSFSIHSTIVIIQKDKDNNIVVTHLNRTNQHCYNFCIPPQFQ